MYAREERILLIEIMILRYLMFCLDVIACYCLYVAYCVLLGLWIASIKQCCGMHTLEF